MSDLISIVASAAAAAISAGAKGASIGNVAKPAGSITATLVSSVLSLMSTGNSRR